MINKILVKLGIINQVTCDDVLFENKLYEIVVDEIQNGELNKGAYGKALSKALGDKQVADALYIDIRVNLLKAEIMRYINQSNSANTPKSTTSSHNYIPPYKTIACRKCNRPTTVESHITSATCDNCK